MESRLQNLPPKGLYTIRLDGHAQYPWEIVSGPFTARVCVCVWNEAWNADAAKHTAKKGYHERIVAPNKNMTLKRENKTPKTNTKTQKTRKKG